MKKVFKNPIFMFVLGALIFGSIGVAATEILASSIKYKETTVDKAIDELYTISSSYKNLSTVTTVNPNNLLVGETAYNSNGELVTGELSTNEFKTLLIVDGQTNTKSEIELYNSTFNTVYTKYKVTNINCDSSNSVNIFYMNSSFTTSNNIVLNTVYDINENNSRIFLQKTSGSSWCQIVLSLFN